MPLYPPPASGSGSVATDTIWDAAGDLAVGTGADTAAKVALGAGGTVLTSNGSTAAWAAPSAGPISIVSRSSDSSPINNSNTLTADDTLLFAVSGNSSDVWFFESHLMFITGASGATSDLKIGWTVPSGTTMAWGYGYIAGASGVPGSPTSGAAGTLTALNGAGGTAIYPGGNGALLLAYASGYVIVGGTSGNVNLTWAQNTATVDNLVLKKGSHLRLTKVV